MKIVFMGTPAIARTCLAALHNAGHEVIAAYTKPDTPKNRGMKMTMSEVKQYALEENIPVIQPSTFKDDAVYEELKAFRPELIVSVAYGKILPQRVLDIPKYGCINMHASILPKLRGAGPVQWAILNHEKETGVTAMYMSAGMDEGDIIEIRRTAIGPAETSGELLDRLADIAAELACDTVTAIARGTVQRTPQESDKATYAPMLTKELSPIHWEEPAAYICDQVRGLVPWPVATAVLAGKTFKIFQAMPSDKTTDASPGTPIALTKKGLEIACGQGEVITITRLQAEGGKQMSAPDYFRGHPIAL